MPLAVEIRVPSGAEHLQQKINDVEAALQDEHPGKIFDAAKNLLETIFRTIITDKNGEIQLVNNQEPHLLDLYLQAKNSLPDFSREVGAAGMLAEVCKKVVRVTGYCRNNYGFASHGQDGYTEHQVRQEEAVFVSNVAISLVNFLYGLHIASPMSYKNSRIIYGNHAAFNDYLDDTNDPVVIAGISMSPSEALFMTDQSAYRELLIDYTENPPETEDFGSDDD